MTTTTTHPGPPAGLARIDLRVGGMTCGSCAARIEELVQTVRAVGYTATPPVSKKDAGAPAERDEAAEAESSLRTRFLTCVALAIPVLALAMIPALQFRHWQWAVLTLATPIVTWGAWPFHRAALANLRHGAATMDTLISLGTTVSYVWTLSALFWAGQANPACTPPSPSCRPNTAAGRPKCMSRSGSP